jgi:hypothetical protein
MLDAGILQPANQRQDESFSRPLVVDGSVEGAAFAAIPGANVKVFGYYSAALKMISQPNYLFGDARQLVHPFVALVK